MGWSRHQRFYYFPPGDSSTQPGVQTPAAEGDWSSKQVSRQIKEWNPGGSMSVYRDNAQGVGTAQFLSPHVGSAGVTRLEPESVNTALE